MRLRYIEKIAITCVFVGWFILATVTVRLGSLERDVRFFDVAEMLGDPLRMFFGMKSAWMSFVFGAVCIVLLIAAWLPSRQHARLALLAGCGPLLLMVCCTVLLLARTSGDFLAAPAETGRIGGNVIEFANGLARRGGGLVAHHIAVGAGALLAFAASLVVAGAALRRFIRSGY